ncbi:hypothetical protein PROFUN_01359 [Planoprotostelium fungivorum]|uniref:Trafficking protein particle complex subunit 13-like n=1 Tax=Planoprotostelium fungivorum TaxID=1890364 RepID=A0A2P6NZW4_9EUKA|nr:hypothetical protein PROFUN_01359 [Planoprotostelium fungivorum]
MADNRNLGSSSLSSSNLGNPLEPKEIHSLTLKALPIYSEKTDIAHDSDSDDAFGVSTILTLPQAFVNMFLGETFKSYISIHNHSPFDVKNVTMKAEMQTGTKRFALADVNTPIISFQSGESHDYVVSHEVKEIGIHILVCTVSYTRHTGESKSFRKFFKFQVMNPISIKMQTHDLQHGIFLTAQIQNLTTNPLFLETVRFEPLPLYVATDLNQMEDNSKSLGGVLGDLIYMKPSDVRQYLFKVKEVDDVELMNQVEPKGESRGKIGSVIGKLELTWKSNFGESGRLQTAPLERKVPQRLELELSVRNAPSHILLERPFTIDCELTNTSNRNISPKLHYARDKMTGVSVDGTMRYDGLTQPVQPGASVHITLRLFPTKPGVQKVKKKKKKMMI